MSATTLDQRIRALLPQLPPALRAAAGVVLDQPGVAVTRSMRDFAAQAKLPPATLVRLAQQLGFEGWQGLKQQLVDDMGLAAGYGQRAQQLQRAHTPGPTLQALTQAQQANLRAVEAESFPALADAARDLTQASQVHVAGFRACFGLAAWFAYVYRLLRAEVSLLDGHAGGLEMQWRAMAEGEALLVMSFAPYSREALASARLARERGLRVIALTDSQGSPLAAEADLVLPFGTASSSFFPSTVAALAVLEGLLTLLASEKDPAMLRRLQEAEAQLFRTGAYESAAPTLPPEAPGTRARPARTPRAASEPAAPPPSPARRTPR